MVLRRQALTSSGAALLRRGHVLSEADIAMLAQGGVAEIDVDDALSAYERARPLYATHVEAVALQALNGIIMLHPGIDEPVRPAALASLLRVLDEMVRGVLPDAEGTLDLSGLDTMTGRDYIHPIKVAELCVLLGRAVGMRKADLVSLANAAALMNLGYAALRRSLLDEPRALEEHEWRHQVELHPEYSERILARAGLSHETMTAIGEHHERWDGSGYPRGLQGKAITVFARIIAIGDTYISMRSRRAYRNALSHEDALELVREGADEFFDPELVRVFVEMIGRVIAVEPAAHAAAARGAGSADEREEANATLRSKVAEGAADAAAASTPREPEDEADEQPPVHAPVSPRPAPAIAVRRAAPAVAQRSVVPVRAAPPATVLRRPDVRPRPARRARRRPRASLWSAPLYLDAAINGCWSELRER